MAASSDKTRSSETSKQLLYSEMFDDVLEEKLKIKKKEIGPRKTFRPTPSSLLGKVEAFLPQLASSNEELLSKPADDVNIENVAEDHDGPMIEMDFALVPDFESGSDDSESDSSSSDDDDDKNTESKEKPSLSLEIEVPAADQHNRKRKIVDLSAEEKDKDSTEDSGKNG